jgi:uracil-DNA glycosylase
MMDTEDLVLKEINEKVICCSLCPRLLSYIKQVGKTGRIFTGDSSGDWVIRAMFETGFANKPTSLSKNDGLVLNGAYMTAAVKCAPPHNKPNPCEKSNCSQ